MAIEFGCSSSINGSNEMLGCDSLSLSCVCLIEDGVLRFCHVACEEEASLDDLHRVFEVSPHVQGSPSDTFNLKCYNSLITCYINIIKHDFYCILRHK